MSAGVLALRYGFAFGDTALGNTVFASLDRALDRLRLDRRGVAKHA